MKDSGLTKVKNIDIQDEDLYLALRKYNKALPKGKTPMKIFYLNDQLFGSLKIYFQFRNPVNLTSILKIGDSATEKLRTKFKFQTQSTDYIPVTNESSVDDIIQFVIDQFNIQDPRSQFCLYEKYSDYGKAFECYRRLEGTENPLNIVLNWCHTNKIKRFSLELFDYDPNVEELHENKSIEELKYALQKMDIEEETSVARIHRKYFQLYQIYSQYLEERRSDQNFNCPASSKLDKIPTQYSEEENIQSVEETHSTEKREIWRKSQRKKNKKKRKGT